MRKHYDFSKAVKNPYFKKIRKTKAVVEPEINIEYKEAKVIFKKFTDLEKRISKLESKNKTKFMKKG